MSSKVIEAGAGVHSLAMAVAVSFLPYNRALLTGTRWHGSRSPVGDCTVRRPIRSRTDVGYSFNVGHCQILYTRNDTWIFQMSIRMATSMHRYQM